MIKTITKAIVVTGALCALNLGLGNLAGKLARINYQANYPFSFQNKIDFVFEATAIATFSALSLGEAIGAMTAKRLLKGQLFKHGIHTYYALTDDEIEYIKLYRGTVYD
jgi:hypothetical protein